MAETAPENPLNLLLSDRMNKTQTQNPLLFCPWILVRFFCSNQKGGRNVKAENCLNLLLSQAIFQSVRFFSSLQIKRVAETAPGNSLNLLLSQALFKSVRFALQIKRVAETAPENLLNLLLSQALFKSGCSEGSLPFSVEVEHLLNPLLPQAPLKSSHFRKNLFPGN